MRILCLAIVLPLAGCLVGEDMKNAAVEDKKADDGWDVDGDGYVSTDKGGDDCDDQNDAIHPNASEICDGYDNNCNGQMDGQNEVDADGDAYLACTVTGATVLNTEYLGSGDCNDSDTTIFPGAAEVCDEVDNNCDGVADEAEAVDAPSWYTDADGDGYGDDATAVVDCVQPTETVSDNTDCNDDDIGIHPEATELVGNGVDDNCDGEEDCYKDSDNDGHAEEGGAILSSMDPACTGSGVANDDAPRDDCDDSVNTIHPGADEYCNNIDDDCDGTTDENDAVDTTDWYMDADNDGFGTGTLAQPSCEPVSGRADNDADCDDGDATISPSAAEICDGIDNNCDGDTDEDSSTDAVLWYKDADGDGQGNSVVPITSTGPSCTPAPSSYVDNTDDCDDLDATVYLGATELCDGLDNDCNGAIPTNESDVDSDRYVECTLDAGGWDGPTFTALGGDDCNDSLFSVNPGADETCNGVDNNCDGDPELYATDGTTYYLDADGDLHGDNTNPTVMCSLPSGYSTLSDDCDDDEATVNPSAAELCDGLDNNCDSSIPTNESDVDSDQYVECTLDAGGWDGPTFTPLGGDDCDDSLSSVNPGAAEACDGVDTDCNGTTPSSELDVDVDGYVECTWSSLGIYAWLGTTEPTGGGDCDDSASGGSINPGTTDTWYDGIDSDCDGASDYDADSDGFDSTDHSGTDCNDWDAAINPNATEISNNDVDEDCDGTAQASLIDLGVGMGNSCAVDDTDGSWGVIHCWGDSIHTIVTNAPTTSAYTEVEVGIQDACTLNRNGFLTCWGETSSYAYAPPSNISYMSQSLSLGAEHGCALDVNPSGNFGGYEADCWGISCSQGECSVPRDSSMQEFQYTDVAAGLGVSCAVDPFGALSCWGNYLSQVMVNYSNVQSTYSSVELSPMQDVGCALDIYGYIDCFGDVNSPIIYWAPYNTDYTDLSCGAESCCALDISGYIECWGGDSVPDTIPSGTGWTTLSVGFNMACAIDSNDELTCWGASCDSLDPACTDHP